MAAPKIAFIAADSAEAKEAETALVARYGAVDWRNADIMVVLGGDGTMLRVMHRERGLTSIIATHNPRLAAACDRVLRLEEGKLREA